MCEGPECKGELYKEAINLYHSMRPYADHLNILVNGLACHILVTVCLHGSNLNVHAKLEKLRPSQDTIWLLNSSHEG